MDSITELTATVQREVEAYGQGGSWKAIIYPVSDTVRQTFTVLHIPDYPRPFPAAIVVAARIVDGCVVIDEDITDRPLVNALIEAGIPREKIICTYVGE
jgi:hypothetical protein